MDARARKRVGATVAACVVGVAVWRLLIVPTATPTTDPAAAPPTTEAAATEDTAGVRLAPRTGDGDVGSRPLHAPPTGSSDSKARGKGTAGTTHDEPRAEDAPTTTLDATVTDAATGAPLRSFAGHAHHAGHSTFVAFDGTNGRLSIAWPRWWTADEGGTLDVAVESAGYVPVQVPVRYEPGQHAATIAVRLEPVREGAAVRFEIADAAGRPLDAPWWARIVDPRDAAKTLQDLGVLVRTAPGRYEASAPPGRWTILVKPNDWLGFLRWTGEVDVAERSVATVPLVFPRFGSLVVRVGPAGLGPERATLVVTRAGERTGSGVEMEPGRREFRSDTCPEGDYRVRWIGSAMRGLGEKAIRIRPGEETVVDFGP